jgi:hypothetical protein
VLRKISAQLAVKTLATAVAVAAVTVAVAPSASAAATSVAWGSMSQAQYKAQSQCFNWGYQNASNATYEWDDSRNQWKATVQCW